MLRAIINMKRSKETASAAVSIALAFSVFSTLVAIFYVRSQKELEVGQSIYLVTGDWKPYTGEDIPHSGIISAIVEATFRDMGYDPQLIFAPWPTGLDLLEASETDTEARAAFAFRQDEDREARFDFSEDPLFTYEADLYFSERDDSPIKPNTPLTKLKGCTVIKIEGYSYPDFFEELAGRNAIEYVKSNVEAFDKVLNGKAPYIHYESRDVALHTIRTHFEGRAQHLRTFQSDDLEMSEPVYMAWSRSNPNNTRLREAFDAALQELKDSGKYREIVSRVTKELDREWTFILRARSAESEIEAFSDKGRFIVPSGTLVVVERWGQGYFPSNETASNDFDTHVRFVNGPVAGTRAIINGQAVEFTPAP